MDHDSSGAPYAAGELIVTYEEEAPLGAIGSLAEEGRGEIKGHLPAIDARLLEFPWVKGERSRVVRERDLARIKENLERDPAVESVDYNYLRTPSFTPNDPRFDEQWGLIKAGFEDTWSRTRGKGVRIAVVDSGAEVINCSFIGPGDSRALKDAIDHAAKKGAVVVAAAGNGDTNKPKYPAAYPGVVAVAVTNQQDRRTSFSNYGSWVDVAAPGVGILSTFPGGYRSLNGTSVAAPHVSALAGLLAAQGRGPPAIRDRILKTALDLGPKGRDPYYGHGRIRADLATRRWRPGGRALPKATAAAGPPRTGEAGTRSDLV